MIRSSYIHEYDEVDELITEYKSNEKFFENADTEFELLMNDLDRIVLFKESGDEVDLFLEKTDSLIKRIGDKIIEIFKKCEEFIDKKIDQIKNFFWKRKDKDKILEKLGKENPKLAERIKIQVDAKKLSLNDFNDINNFYKNIDKALDEIEKDNYESAEAKAIRAKEKLEKSVNTIIKVSSVVGAVGTVAINFNRLREYMRNRNDTRTTQQKIRDFQRETGRRVTSMTRKIDGFDVTFESGDYITESSKKPMRDLKKRLSSLSKISNIVTTKSKELLNQQLMYMMTMENASDKFIDQMNRDMNQAIRDQQIQQQQMQIQQMNMMNMGMM